MADIKRTDVVALLHHQRADCTEQEDLRLMEVLVCIRNIDTFQIYP